MVGQARLPDGEGARFVEDHGAHAVSGFQRLGIFDQNAMFGGHPGADHDGHRRGQAQRARAGNHQHRHCVNERCFKISPDRQPDAHSGQRHP